MLNVPSVLVFFIHWLIEGESGLGLFNATPWRAVIQQQRLQFAVFVKVGSAFTLKSQFPCCNLDAILLPAKTCRRQTRCCFYKDAVTAAVVCLFVCYLFFFSSKKTSRLKTGAPKTNGQLREALHFQRLARNASPGCSYFSSLSVWNVSFRRLKILIPVLQMCTQHVVLVDRRHVNFGVLNDSKTLTRLGYMQCELLHLEK